MANNNAATNGPPATSMQTFSHSIAQHGSYQIFGNERTIVNISQPALPEERLPSEICDAPDLLSPHFISRTAELETIRRVISSVSNGVPPRCVIFGMPGLGKTQLALKYAISAFENKQHPYIFWISATSTEKLKDGFARLLDLTGHPSRAVTDQDVKLTSVRRWLEELILDSNKKWLLVVDNVHRESVATLRSILPKRSAHGSIIITTRLKTTAEALALAFGVKHTTIELKQPSLDDAVALLLTGSNPDLIDSSRRQNAVKLVKSVGCLPLAVDQAASFMRESECSISELLHNYTSENIGATMDWENDLSLYEERSVSAAFVLAFERLTETAPTAANFLRLLAFLDPERIAVDMLVKGSSVLNEDLSVFFLPFQDKPPVRRKGKRKSKRKSSLIPAIEDDRQPASVAEDLFQLFQSPPELQKAIIHLQRLSLTVSSRSAEGAQVLWIHDLVQLLLRTKFIPASERAMWLTFAIIIVNKALFIVGDPSEPQHWPQFKRFIPHLECIAKHSKPLSFESSLLVPANMLMVNYFISSGLLNAAQKCLTQTISNSKDVLGEENPLTLTSMSNLANTLNNQGRWDEAEKLNLQVLEIQKRVLGPEHRQTLITSSNLALVFRENGQYDKAEQLQVELVATAKRVFGLEHFLTVDNMNNLAATFWIKGKLEVAEKLMVQVLEIRTRRSGPEHPSTLNTMSNLAATYSSQGKHDMAQKLNTEMVAIRERVLGPEHPSTLVGLNNLATSLMNNKELKRAEALFVRVMESRNKVLGQEHPDTLVSMSNLANIYRHMERLEEAEGLGSKSLDIQKRVLGPEHPNTLISIISLATTWHEQGRKEEAFRVMADTSVILNRTLGLKHPATVSSKMSLILWHLEGTTG